MNQNIAHPSPKLPNPVYPALLIQQIGHDFHDPETDLTFKRINWSSKNSIHTAIYRDHQGNTYRVTVEPNPIPDTKPLPPAFAITTLQALEADQFNHFIAGPYTSLEQAQSKEIAFDIPPPNYVIVELDPERDPNVEPPIRARWNSSRRIWE